jgi:hypothetical protein
MQIAWTKELNDLKNLFEWCGRQILARSSEDLAELSGVISVSGSKTSDGDIAVSLSPRY